MCCTENHDLCPEKPIIQPFHDLGLVSPALFCYM